MAPTNNAASSAATDIDACTVFGNVNQPPPKQTNLRKYGQQYPHLLIKQVEQLIAVIPKHSRLPDRDRLLIWTAFVHGMRVGEVTKLRWSHVQRGIRTPKICIDRLKDSDSGYHPIEHRELQYWARLENYIKRHSKWHC
jgi:integrase